MAKTPNSGSVLPPQSAALAEALAALAKAAQALLSLASAPRNEVSALAGNALSLASPSQARLKSVAAAMVESKDRNGCSASYLEQLGIGFAQLVKGLGNPRICEVTSEDLERWAASLSGAPRTRRGRIVYAKSLFKWAQRRGMIGFNPADALDLPRLEAMKVAVHTPDQVRRVLREAMAECPGLAKALAIRYFAGLRTIELDRLEPEDVGAGYIEVSARKSKTRSRRLVSIQPNLVEWLRVSDWIPGDLEKRISRLAQGIGVPWPSNVTRHSFCSYHLAGFESPGKTALQAGHSEQMLFQHYRELVTPEQALEFWQIRPATLARSGGGG